MGHSLTFLTSPRRSASDFRVIVNRCRVSAATKFAGITCFTAATALAFATAATQSDLRPSGAMTSTTGIFLRTFDILGMRTGRKQFQVSHWAETGQYPKGEIKEGHGPSSPPP